jgi:cytochrome c oxidase assembly factor CtaG
MDPFTMSVRPTLAVLLSLSAIDATAHVVSADDPGGSLFVWTFEPWVVILMAATLLIYVVGYLRLRNRSGRGRAARTGQLAAFGCGWLALVVALNSPLDALSAELFSAHMVQHEMLMIVAAPLLVIGRPFGVWVWAFPKRARDAISRAIRAQYIRVPWRWLTKPTVAWLLHATALWGWHVPRLFEAALRSSIVHSMQHTSFLVTALLFWWTVFGEPARRSNGAHAMLSLFTTMVHTGALGALLTLAPGLWYPTYIESSTALGFDPLHDQQLGGLVMWVPGGLAYLASAIVLSARWLMRTPLGFSKASVASRQDG